MEPALRRPTKKHLALQLCKGNALKIVRANPGLGQGPPRDVEMKLLSVLMITWLSITAS